MGTECLQLVAQCYYRDTRMPIYPGRCSFASPSRVRLEGLSPANRPALMRRQR